MDTLKLISLTVVQPAREAWFLPQSVANAAEQRRRLAVQNEIEAGRLDRIRNPSKHLGQ
jgi:hypothetical protein